MDNWKRFVELFKCRGLFSLNLDWPAGKLDYKWILPSQQWLLPIANKYKDVGTCSMKRRKAILPQKKTRSSQWEEKNKCRRRMNLSWRQSKQIYLYPPIWERVSCYVSLQSWSICPSNPSHRHVSPSSPQTESSHQQSSWLIPSLLPITPLASQTCAHANSSQGSLLNSSRSGRHNPIQHCLCQIQKSTFGTFAVETLLQL